MADLTDALRLAETLCARICHDLSGALGTLGGSLELLQDVAAPGDEILAIACDSATVLQQRLKLVRAAWGANPAPLPLAELRSLAAGLPGAHKLSLDLDGLPADSVFPPNAGRAAIALLLLAAASLPSGGRIALAGSPTDLVLTITGRHAAWPPGFGACLHDEAAMLATFGDPRGLAMPLAILFARGSGMQLSMLLAAGPGGAVPPPLRLTAH